MAAKIQLRHGNAAMIPALDVAEPGWEVDTKTYRIGDGTAAPPRIPSTKSTGSFDFPSVNYFSIPKVILGLGVVNAVSLYFAPTDPATGLYSPGTNAIAVATNGVQRLLLNNAGAALTGDLVMNTGGKVDGVDISNLNPAGINGIMVKTADNTYAFRSLVPGNGMSAMVNNQGQTNPGGAAGDIVIGMVNNPTVPGNAAIKIPAGTTGDRAGVSPVDGHFRYNMSKKSFEGRIDGEWRELVDYVEGKTVTVPAQLPSIQDAIDYFDNRSTKSNVTVLLQSGVQSVATPLSPGSRTNRVVIRGQDPIRVNLDANTPVLAVSGTPGNYLVQYKLAGPVPTGITTDHSIIINEMTGSGDSPFYDWTDQDTCGAEVRQANLSELNCRTNKWKLTDHYQPNDYIMCAPGQSEPHFRRCTSITNDYTIVCDSPWPEVSADKFFHRRLRRLTGTISAAQSTTVTGAGTAFLTELNVGDVVITNGTKQSLRVVSIQSNTQFTAACAMTVTAEVACQVINAALHHGCWKISSIDTIAQTITVVNTVRSIAPPPKYGVKRGAVNFMPSTILFSSDKLMTLVQNEFIGFQNVVVRYTGAAPTAYNYGVQAIGGDVWIGGLVGFVNAAVHITQGATIGGDRLFVTGHARVDGVALNVAYGSSLAMYQVIASGNINTGALFAYSEALVWGSMRMCGNAGDGMMAQASNVWMGQGGHVLYNGGKGISSVENSYVGMNMPTVIGNGKHGVYTWMQGSTNLWNCGLILCNVGSNLCFNQGGFQHCSGSVNSGSQDCGVKADTGCVVELPACTTTSHDKCGVKADNNCTVKMPCSGTIEHCNEHPIFCDNNTHCHVEKHKCKKKFPHHNDGHCWTNSIIKFIKCIGSIAITFEMNCSPITNGSPGNRDAKCFHVRT